MFNQRNRFSFSPLLLSFFFSNRHRKIEIQIIIMLAEVCIIKSFILPFRVEKQFKSLITSCEPINLYTIQLNSWVFFMLPAHIWFNLRWRNIYFARFMLGLQIILVFGNFLLPLFHNFQVTQVISSVRNIRQSKQESSLRKLKHLLTICYCLCIYLFIYLFFYPGHLFS